MTPGSHVGLLVPGKVHQPPRGQAAVGIAGEDEAKTRLGGGCRSRAEPAGTAELVGLILIDEAVVVSGGRFKPVEVDLYRVVVLGDGSDGAGRYDLLELRVRG